MDTTEQIYRLVGQWCNSLDPYKASEALHQIAIITGCIPQPPKQWTEEEGKHVLGWLQEHHPNAYLWAMSQSWIGHPAIIWGTESNLKRSMSARRR